MDTIKRCLWATKNTLEEQYHDTEWGVPIYDDQKLFEFINLEGAQAGLSWITILKKRDNYRLAFDQFDAKKIVLYDQSKIDLLLQNKGIVRNKLKVNAVVSNATAFLEIQKEFGSFSEYIWQFVDHKPIHNQWAKHTDVPTKTNLSEEMSKALKAKGFKFVGSTICYAFMEAVGMVNDHTTDCFRHGEV